MQMVAARSLNGYVITTQDRPWTIPCIYSDKNLKPFTNHSSFFAHEYIASAMQTLSAWSFDAWCYNYSRQIIPGIYLDKKIRTSSISEIAHCFLFMSILHQQCRCYQHGLLTADIIINSKQTVPGIYIDKKLKPFTNHSSFFVLEYIAPAMQTLSAWSFDAWCYN